MNELRRISSFAACALAICLGSPGAFAGPISFVSAATGVNAGDCSSPASPCKTFAFAFSRTSAGGEIKALDPGSYGQVTITNSITITGVEGAGILLTAAGAAAITIDAGANDVVSLVGLTLDGSKRTAADGVLLNTGGVLFVKNCVIKNFSNSAINLLPTGATKALIEDTLASGNNNEAIRFRPVGSGTLNGTLNRVSSVMNNFDGMRVFGGATALVADSVFSGDSADGILVGSSGSPGGLVRLTRSTFTRNGTGVRVLSSAPGAAAESAGDNLIRGNATDVDGTLTSLGTQ